jgi:predicted flap endonuclease-1-like 5' DNA nuclease
MSDQPAQTLAVFVVDKAAGSRRLLERIRKIDETDNNVQIVDAAIVDRTRFGRVKVHQTKDMGAAKGAFHGGAIGVVVGALLLGPAGAVVGGAAGGVLHGLRSRFHDIGIDDKFMRQVGKEVDKGKSALFVQYVGNWAASIGLVEEVVVAEHALLIHSTLRAETAAKLQALVEPAVEQLGGEEAVSDYEVEEAEAPAEEATAEAPAETAAPEAAAVAAVAAAAAPAADDLTQLVGIGPKAAKALAAAGIGTYAALADANEPAIRRALHEADMLPPGNVSSWPMQASLAAKGDWQGLMKYNAKASAAAPKAAKPKAASAAAGPPDDLTKISGIGPRMATILEDGGVTTYSGLQHTSSEDLRKVVAAGGALPPSSLSSWPTQATFAAKGDWQGLASYNSHR